MEDVPTYNSEAKKRTITKKEMLQALESIPDDGVITIAVEHGDYLYAKNQNSSLSSVHLGIPGDHSFDEKGICFLTWPLKR